MLKSGLKTKSTVKLTDKNGRVIVYSETTKNPLLKNFETFRCQYCLNHRNKKLWQSFRLGKTNLPVLVYGLYLKLFGG